MRGRDSERGGGGREIVRGRGRGRDSEREGGGGGGVRGR